MKLLLDAGDDPTPGLSEAILGDHADIVHLLLARGAKHRKKDDGIQELNMA